MKQLKPDTKRSIAGYLFISPFIAGVFLIFSYAVIMSVLFSVSDISLSPKGYSLTFAGLKHFKEALLVNPTYNRSLVDSVRMTVVNVPLVLMFSFFMAALLNQSFKGRSIARVIFFMPVIMSTGVIQKLDNFSQLQGGLSGSSIGTAMSQLTGFVDLGSLLMSLNIAPSAVAYITNGVESIYQIIGMSGIQMLVFLMALQSIPPSLYEASSIEGASGWETMWKITFPMVTPYILTNVIYTTIDSFTSYNNPVMWEISAFSQGGSINYSYVTTMSLIYFAVIGAILSVVAFVLSKAVFYQN